MKNLILLLAIAVLTSCSKDSLDINFEDISAPEKSEISVVVSYLSWEDNCGNVCNGEGGYTVIFIDNAMVNLYRGNSSGSDASASPIFDLPTNSKGQVIFHGIEPGTYTVAVETALGIKSRTITTALHKRSYIDFSF